MNQWLIGIGLERHIAKTSYIEPYVKFIVDIGSNLATMAFEDKSMDF